MGQKIEKKLLNKANFRIINIIQKMERENCRMCQKSDIKIADGLCSICDMDLQKKNCLICQKKDIMVADGLCSMRDTNAQKEELSNMPKQWYNS